MFEGCASHDINQRDATVLGVYPKDLLGSPLTGPVSQIRSNFFAAGELRSSDGGDGPQVTSIAKQI